MGEIEAFARRRDLGLDTADPPAGLERLAPSARLVAQPKTGPTFAQGPLGRVEIGGAHLRFPVLAGRQGGQQSRDIGRIAEEFQLDFVRLRDHAASRRKDFLPDRYSL